VRRSAVIPFFCHIIYYYNDLSFEEFENYKGHFAVILHMPASLPVTAHTEMIKDLENLKGDLAIIIKRFQLYGEMVSKQIITALTTTILPVYVLIEIYDVGYMDIYFIPV
jgi:4-hydroxybenzoate polyprenyltransferase